MSPTLYSTEIQFKPPVVSASSEYIQYLVWFKLPFSVLLLCTLLKLSLSPPVVSASSEYNSILVWFKLPLVSPTVYSTEAQFKAASSVC